MNAGLMMQRVRHVAVLGKTGRPDVQELGGRIVEWLTARSIKAGFSPAASDDPLFAATVDEADLVLALGGDGTLVSIARHFAADPRPLLGINFGTVGFLAEIPAAGWERALERVLEQGVYIEECMGLQYGLYRDNRPVAAGISVNDLAVTRGGLARLATFELCVDEIPLSTVRADGLLISTAMGSTGYTGSNRGPLIYPGLEAYAVTAICPFMSNFLPLVLDGRTSFTIAVREAGKELSLTVDGQELYPLEAGDSIHAVGSPGRILFARLKPGGAYYTKLSAVGFMGEPLNPGRKT